MNTPKQKVVMLCSGGMDSVAALYEASRDFEISAVLIFHYGSKHNNREISFAGLPLGNSVCLLHEKI